MIDVSRHIEYLLLEHDVVSVPQLGTFCIRQTPSRRVAEEDLFLPPVRNVSFAFECNAADEDFFILSLSTSLRISQEQAQIVCTEYVESLRQELAANSVVEVGSIGMFVRDSSTGADCFMPCQAGVTSPAFYGLDSVYQPCLPENARKSGMSVHAGDHRKKRDDRHVTIRIPRSLLYYASAAAAAIIVFLSFSTPVAYMSPESGASVATANLFLPANLLPSVEVSPQPAVVRAEVPVQENAIRQDSTGNCEAKPAPQTAEEDVERKEDMPASTDKEVSEVQSQPEFAVVLASAVSTANAERYVKELNSRGIKAEMRAKGSMTRVLVAGFNSSDEAHDYARQIRAQGTEFDAAWVLKL